MPLWVGFRRECSVIEGIRPLRGRLMGSVISSLDYAYAWRLLLPFGLTARLVTVGLGAEKSAWWTEELNRANAGSIVGAGLEGALIDLEGSESDDREGLASTVDWVAAWGAGGDVSKFKRSLPGRFSHVREYALIPPSRPRVVVPLQDSRNAVVTLGLHRPGRTVARLVVFFVRGLARLGVRVLLRRTVLIVAADPCSTARFGVGREIDSQADYGLYLGTPSEDRKTVALPLVRGRADRVLKVSSSESSKRAILNEIESLHVLERSNVSRMIPRLVDSYVVGGSLFLVQEYRERVPISKASLRAEAIDFLAELSVVERKQCSLGEYLELKGLNIAPQRATGCSDAGDRVLERLNSRASEMIWLHRSHGDFAPWNSSYTDHGFFVFDWEDSSPNVPALFDAFYFVISEWVHLSRSDPPEKVVAKSIQFARKVADSTSLFIDDLKVYLGLWLLVCGKRFSRNEELLNVLDLEMA